MNVLMAVVLLAFLPSCNKPTSTPMGPQGGTNADGGGSPNPAPTTYELSGTVTEAGTGAPIAGARVEVTDGSHAGKFATTGADGGYAIAGLSGGMTVRASRSGFRDRSLPVDMTANKTLDFVLERDDASGGGGGPGAGTHTLSGRVTDGGEDEDDGIAGAHVEVTDGPHEGKFAKTDGTGHYSILGLSGGMTVRASRDGFGSDSRPVNMNQDRTLNFVLAEEAPAPPPPSPASVAMCLDLDDEEVHITNNSSSDLDLTGWYLRDDHDRHKFEFVQNRPCRPSMSGFVLAAGRTVIVTSGDSPEHAPPSKIIGWCNDVWNNGGDTARLFDASGAFVTSAEGSFDSCS